MPAITHADGSISVTSPIAVTIVPQNPGIFARYGTTRGRALSTTASSNATAVLSVDGTINAGDVVTISLARSGRDQ